VQEEAWHRHLSELWNRIEQAWDAKRERLRSPLPELVLGICSRVLSWMEELDETETDRLSPETVDMVARATHFAEDILEVLNKDDPISPKDAAGLHGNLSDLARILGDLTAAAPDSPAAAGRDKQRKSGGRTSGSPKSGRSKSGPSSSRRKDSAPGAAM
jgi:hypothetical protein